MKFEARGISLCYTGCPVLDKVDFSLGAGELVGLIGPNGAGKTTLLRILAGLLQADSGEVALDGNPLHRISRRRLARTLAYLEQGAPAHWPLTVRRVIELGRFPHLGPWQSLTDEDQQLVEQAMKMADVDLLANRTVTTLSGGERLRVMLGRIFATRPQIIIADEPIAALDPYHQLHTMELLREHCQRGGSAVVVLHDLNMAARFCDRLVLLNLGHIVQDSSPEEMLASEHLASVYGITVDCIQHDKGLWVVPRDRVKWPQAD
jgi:iron complex transport system ATP-binding protein